MSKGDTLNADIVRLLQVDGRMSNREIGRELGVPESTVRSRLKRMFDSKELRLGVVLSPAALGVNVIATLHLTVSPGYIRRVALSLAELNEVGYVSIVAGHYDVLSLVTAVDELALLKLVQDFVEPLEGVQSVDVRQISQNIKHSYTEVRIN